MKYIVIMVVIYIIKIAVLLQSEDSIKMEVVENILQYEQGGIKWTKYCKDSE